MVSSLILMIEAVLTFCLGIYEVMHPSDEVRIAKKLKGKTPDQIERIRSEVNILQTLKDLKSAHINFMYDVSNNGQPTTPVAQTY